MPSIITKINDYHVIYKESTNRRSDAENVFAGQIWEFPPELKLQGFDPKAALNILVKTLETHLPGRALGANPLLGSAIPGVSFMHL